MKDLIEIKNLEKVYEDNPGAPATRVLNGINLSIKQGEFVAIMGPSGSGKSTLLHILGLLDRESSGTYLFQEKKTGDYSDDELARTRNRSLGFVFQAFNLLPRVSVLENVMLPLTYSNVPETEWKKRAEDAIEAVDLSHRKDHEPSELSGGEKQRVAIARAIVTDPDVVFADEPTGNLDSKSGERIMEIIQSLHERGKTIILITHETYTSEYAERIIKLFDGKIESDTAVVNRRKKGEVFKK
jgi:putative ABC transport system ATP-binding protein